MLNAISNQKSELVNISSYKLTKLWLEAVENIDINGTTSQVMTALIYHYNPQNEYVFPHQETVARKIKRSVATVKRAISELQALKFIEIKRTRNGNLYKFTPVFFVTLKAKTCTFKEVKNELSMEHDKLTDNTTDKKEEIKKTASDQKKVVSFSISSKSAKPLDLQAIPAIIKENKNIKNPLAYWKSLDDNAKASYISKEKEMLELKKRKLAEEARREKESQENYKKHLELKNAKPFSETCTKDEAIDYIKRMFGANSFMKKVAFKSTTVKQLQAKFLDLDIEQILK